MSISVYAKPGCVQCTATERHLGATPHEVVDLTADESALATVHALGYRAAPVVIIRDDSGDMLDHWSGFNPDAIDAWRQRAA